MPADLKKRPGGAKGGKGTGQVGVDHTVPVFVISQEWAAKANTGGGDQHIDAAITRGLCHGLGHAVAAGQIKAHFGAVATAVTQLAKGGSSRLDVSANHMRTTRGQRQRRGGADAAGGTRDERDLAG